MGLAQFSEYSVYVGRDNPRLRISPLFLISSFVLQFSKTRIISIHLSLPSIIVLKLIETKSGLAEKYIGNCDYVDDIVQAWKLCL